MPKFVAEFEVTLSVTVTKTFDAPDGEAAAEDAGSRETIDTTEAYVLSRWTGRDRPRVWEIDVVDLYEADEPPIDLEKASAEGSA